MIDKMKGMNPFVTLTWLIQTDKNTDSKTDKSDSTPYTPVSDNNHNIDTVLDVVMNGIDSNQFWSLIAFGE